MKYIIFTIMSTLMLSVSRLLLAHISQSNLFLIAPIQWVKSYARIFKFCDELLATSTFLFSSYIIFFILHTALFIYFSPILLIDRRSDPHVLFKAAAEIIRI